MASHTFAGLTADCKLVINNTSRKLIGSHLKAYKLQYAVFIVFIVIV